MVKRKVNGWLVIDKPAGITSTDVVNQLKRLIRPLKIGHAGTLDPFATGILLIAIGESTKLVEYVMDKSKGYEFTVCWGENRDSLDIDGKVTATNGKIPLLADIQAILSEFIGLKAQVPPNYSAIKIAGKRAYQMSRDGEDFALPPRNVTLYDISVIDHKDNQTKFAIKCGRGYYVRSLARDLALRLDTLGYVSTLRRVLSGKFTIADAISLALVEEIVHNAEIDLEKYILPVNAVLDDILVQQVDSQGKIKLQNGQKLPLVIKGQDGDLVAANCSDQLVAICRIKDQFIFPVRVFNY
jgi:tRNA pseudouridine55 synthase